MRESFDKKLAFLNVQLLKMASQVEEIIAVSIKSLKEGDLELAKKAVTLDNEINELEKNIESHCLRILLQYQPVFADDLRRVSAALKMITDMERIGDQASDIAEINIHLISNEELLSMEDVSKMAAKSAQMVSKSIDAYVNQDEKLASDVINSDDEIDNYFIKVRGELVEMIYNDKSKGEQAIETIMIAKYLERIGDHAVNIAEWVLFAIKGEHKHIQIL